ncbi:DUF2239 family protein [Rhodoblastus sp.]|uniref:DUF2239 family protein n=1 Tax=Rhodoblastus sp. TaxID=1962975 RepID=UPI0035B45FB9
MTNALPSSVTIFAGTTRVAQAATPYAGAIARQLLSDDPAARLLVFEDGTGRQVDLDLRDEAQAQPTAEDPSAGDARGRGRPKLGVVAREVTLLPRHWDWLNGQPGGASVALRKLVEQARRDQSESDRRREAREAAYRFVSAMAGDFPGFEEASRALFAGDRGSFIERTVAWPQDVAAYARWLAFRDAA